MQGLTLNDINQQLIIRQLGTIDYVECWHAMQHLTDSRDSDTVDELWLLQHPRVFTQGQAGKAEHVLAPGDIPVIPVDRGGQVTYHGPGQLVVYLMVDLRRRKMGARALVTLIENAIIATLSLHGITASPRPNAPGVYAAEKKIASLGLRIRKGSSFHGLALNIDMDLEPFHRINPCGYQGLEMCQVRDFVETPSFSTILQQLQNQLQSDLGYTSAEILTDPLEVS
ncbi:octanoyltransferase [Gammaproteobacteria bacterium 45_16_T64]|nr:octanoyltransferase [Gammaproteobacteria bacterium 45_16_T64]